MKVEYFGCDRGQPGHSWHGSKHFHSPHPVGPVDAIHAPRIGVDRRTRPEQQSDYRQEAPQGQAALVSVNGWTVLAYWDRSGDYRGASNSAFAAEGVHTFDELLEAAKQQWPWVFERQKFEVVQWSSE